MATTALPQAAAPRIAGGTVLALALLVLATGLAVVRERIAPPPGPLPPVMWMQSPALMDRLALQFDTLVADVYWIRAVVYYGGVRRSEEAAKNYDLLYPLLDLTTTLDPRFLLAYRMGAIFLSEAYPSGAGRSDLAVALLQKGLRYDPNRWELLHDIGFVYFWAERDYVTAAHWLDRASQVPGAPEWIKPVVAGMLTRGGERATARSLWTEMLRSDTPTLQEAARLRLSQLDAMDQIDALHSLIARVTLATGHRPETWRDLIAQGWLRGVPLDPSGTPYAMDPFTGRVSVAPGSGLYPMPDQLPGGR
jgi:hypothetical protein